MEETNVTSVAPGVGPGLETPPPSSFLLAFSHWFSGVHGYASIIVCAFGICTNIFNITILTRRDMRTATNLFLCGLAFSDILTMAPYMPFAIHFYCIHDPDEVSPEKYSEGWATFLLITVNLAATTHTISIWLGVSLSVFRFMQMRTPLRGPQAKQRSLQHVKAVTILVYIISTIAMVPNYLTNKIERHDYGNTSLYGLRDLKLATNETEPIVFANVISYAILAKLVPCALMVIFGGSLLYSVGIKGKKRRRRLSSTNSNCKREVRQSKTTRMLLVVMILFLVTEFPQGILILASALVSGFYDNVYMPLGDLMDFIALVNNAINFVLYCIMSQQFRQRFIDMYLKRTSRMKYFEKISLNNQSFTRTIVTDAT
ncbi:G-protein coupled receptor dmsr-1-like [Argopecten irradians]|uniref:G-protein coupled receptor dmsr-1-like n=1 Tax=Argopecten irradians TaxID=31199 RepID=UPI003719AE69